MLAGLSVLSLDKGDGRVEEFAKLLPQEVLEGRLHGAVGEGGSGALSLALAFGGFVRLLAVFCGCAGRGEEAL